MQLRRETNKIINLKNRITEDEYEYHDAISILNKISMIMKLAKEYYVRIEVKIMNKQIFIDTTMNLFIDSTNVLSDPEVQHVVRKDYSENAFCRIIVD